MTTGLVLVGLCYFVTAAGLRDVPTVARIVLLITGASAIGVAVCPQPAHGSTVQHMVCTGVGELALAVLPAIVSVHRLDHRLLSARAAGVVAALFGVLFLWLVIQLQGGTRLGLAERLTSSVQTCFPFVMALALRHSSPDRRAAVRAGVDY
jgi:ABC-type transport system involved in cytochrome c biogenesis permease subunit